MCKLINTIASRFGIFLFMDQLINNKKHIEVSIDSDLHYVLYFSLNSTW